MDYLLFLKQSYLKIVDNTVDDVVLEYPQKHNNINYKLIIKSVR